MTAAKSVALGPAARRALAACCAVVTARGMRHIAGAAERAAAEDAEAFEAALVDLGASLCVEADCAVDARRGYEGEHVPYEDEPAAYLRRFGRAMGLVADALDEVATLRWRHGPADVAAGEGRGTTRRSEGGVRGDAPEAREGGVTPRPVLVT